MNRFKGQTAVITGGATGIGFATARRLGLEGASVVIAGRNEERGCAAVSALSGVGVDIRFVRTDVTDDAEVEGLAQSAAERTGSIDIWFNNAGIEGTLGELEEIDDRIASEVIDINFKGVYSGMRHAARFMGPGGTIVNNASFVGTVTPVPIAIAYGGTKAAVVSMTRSSAVGLADQGIQVFAVCPYIVDTPMVDRITGGEGIEARAGFAAEFAPSGLLTQSEEIAEVVADLCDARRSATSGDSFLVDALNAVTRLGAESVNT
jgi:NAD(P)-dependent dehydrogenase (short-subunit alcohol dehydrogenase family)